MQTNILTQYVPYKVMMLLWCFLYLDSVSRFPHNTLLRWGVFVGTRTSRKEGGSPNRETASFLPQESIFPAEPTKTQVRKLWRFALFATLKKMGQRESCFFSFHLWGNASLNTSRTTALRKATNHDSVVLSFAVSYWISPCKQEWTASGVASPRWVVSVKMIIFTNISCCVWYKMNKWTLINRLVQRAWLSLRHKETDFTLWKVTGEPFFGLMQRYTGSELFSCQSTVHEGAVARLTRETALPKARSVKQNLGEGVVALKS